MKLFKFGVVVILLYIVGSGRPVLAGVYDLCGKDDIGADDGNIFFNSSSRGQEGKAITCEKIIYMNNRDRVKLTITKMSLQNTDLLEVFDGPLSGKEKITPMHSNGRQIYEASGNTIKVVLKIQKPINSNSISSLEGTFVHVPFHATCRCAGNPNVVSECYENQSEMKCSFYCKKGFVDILNTTGSHTCNLRNGKWNTEYKNGKFGCVSIAQVPEINAVVNFTLSSPICHSINTSTILKPFLSQLFLPQKEMFQNGNCLKKNYSHCLTINNCVDKDNKSIVSVNIKDKAFNSGLDQQTVNSRRLSKAYIIKDKDIKAIATTLINNLNYSKISISDVKSQMTANCPNGISLVSFSNNQAHTCTKCPLGTIYKSDVQTCEICPSGNSSSINCPSEAKHGNFTACENKKCIPGKDIYRKTGFCQWCPYNMYQNSSKINNPKCKYCPDHVTLYPGTASVKDCPKPCNKGKYYDKNSKVCAVCPIGTYQSETFHLYTYCKTCKAGTITHSTGSQRKEECVPFCVKGHFFDAKTKICLKCKIGSYQNKENQLACLQCPKGTSTQVEGSSNITSCFKTCPKGHYLNKQDKSCSKCPLGTYMDIDGHLQFECKKCATSKTTYVDGASTDAECQDACTAGMYFNSHLSLCKNCSIGNYQHDVNQMNCIQCPNGTSTKTEGSSTLSDCIKTCPKGTFIDMQNKSCVNCPFGTYLARDKHLLSACIKCPLQKTTYVSGVSDKEKCFSICKVGNFFNSKSSSCQVCPQGTFQSKPLQQNCIACPPGLNTKKAGATSGLECIRFVCNQGEYLDPKNGNCHPCEIATYQSLFNHTKTECQSCLSGKTKDRGSKDISSCITTCDSFPCENGADCSESSEGFSCKCPPGITGQRCNVIEVQVSIRFLYLNWNKNLSDQSTTAFKNTSSIIEKAILEFGKEIVTAMVRRLSRGSVIADIDLYTKDNASLVPAKTLQNAVAEGSIGDLKVDPEYFSISQVTCSQALGMENGRIQDDQITASSPKDFLGRARLNKKAWRAEVTTGAYLEIHFKRNVNITAIATQGDKNGEFVKTYNISYSSDRDSWKYSLDTNDNIKTYGANSASIFKQDLQQPITSVKYIRVNPITWEKAINMRIELYGCLSDLLIIKPTKPGIDYQPTEDPNVLGTKDEEDDYSWGKYLGIAFGLIMVAVIVVAGIMWWRSSKKKKQKENAPLMLTRVDTKTQDSEKTPNEEEDAV